MGKPEMKMIVMLLMACIGTGGVNCLLSPVSDADLSGFITSFQQLLLEKIAIESNNTASQSEALTIRMEQECKPKLDTAVANCKSCAENKCKSVPSLSDILNVTKPVTYFKGPLDTIGSKINDAKDLIGDKFTPFAKNIIDKINTGMETVANKMKLNEVGNAFSNLGKIIPEKLNQFGNSVKDFFGGKRRRRSVTANFDPKIKPCMDQCSVCTPLQKPTDDEVVTAVCGHDIAGLNATLFAHMAKINDVYSHVVDKQNDIVKNLKIDVTTMTNLELNDVVITWFLDGKYITHKATKPVDLLDMAKPLAKEYWDTYPTPSIIR